MAIFLVSGPLRPYRRGGFCGEFTPGSIGDARALQQGAESSAAERPLIQRFWPWLAVRFAAAMEEAQSAAVLWLAVAFATGIGAYFSLAEEPPLLLSLIPALALGAASWRRSPGGRRLALGLAAAFAAGVAWGTAAALRHDAPVLDHRTRVAALTGAVISLEERERGERRLVIAVEDIDGMAAAETPRRVRLSVRTDTAGAAPGSAVRLKAVLWPPPPPAFPGDLDIGRDLYFQDIGALGIAVSPLDVKASKAGFWTSLGAYVEKVRLAISVRLHNALPGDAGLVADALITGFRGAMPDTLADAMRDAGLAHLLAISGLHMAMVTGIVFFTVRALLALVEPWALKYPIKKWAAAAAMAAAFLYLQISGARVPAERAFIMASLALVAVMIDRRPISMRLVALSALMVLALQPAALLSISFQMSFAAVIALVAFYEHARRQNYSLLPRHGVLARPLGLVGAAVVTTVVSEIAVTPATVFYFGEVPLLGLVANAVAIPVMGVFIMPLLALGVLAMPLGLEGVPLTVAGWGIDLVIEVARWTSSHSGATLHFPPMSLMAYLLMIIGGLWLALWRSRLALLGLMTVALGLALAVAEHPPDIFVAGDGNLVAVRLADGAYALTPGRAQGWERERITRWSMGVTASWPEDGASGDGRLRCDGIGCLYRPRPGMIVALPTRADALADDCLSADVLVADLWLPWRCPAPGIKIGRREKRWDGGARLWFGTAKDPAIRLETVGEKRNGRPWGGRLQKPENRNLQYRR